jgi:hypothetical protein
LQRAKKTFRLWQHVLNRTEETRLHHHMMRCPWLAG